MIGASFYHPGKENVNNILENLRQDIAKNKINAEHKNLHTVLSKFGKNLDKVRVLFYL